MLALLKGCLMAEDVPHPRQEPLCGAAPSDPCPGARCQRSPHPTEGIAGGRGIYFSLKLLDQHHPWARLTAAMQGCVQFETIRDSRISFGAPKAPPRLRGTWSLEADQGTCTESC